jgi:hypothetical protein
VIASFREVWDDVDQLIYDLQYAMKAKQMLNIMSTVYLNYFRAFPRFSVLARATAWRAVEAETKSDRILWLVTRTMLRNTTRVHRNLRKVFSVVLEDMTDANIELAVRLMAFQLEVGFTLDVSDVSEYGFVFWLIDFFTQMRLSLVLQDESRKHELAELQVNKVLFGCFFRLFVALEVGGYLKFPDPVVEARGGVYALRTKNFIGVGPYENFQKAANLHAKDADQVLVAVADALRNASASCSDADVKRTCITNILAIGALLKGGVKVTKTTFKYSKLFPVVEVDKISFH